MSPTPWVIQESDPHGAQEPPSPWGWDKLSLETGGVCRRIRVPRGSPGRQAGFPGESPKAGADKGVPGHQDPAQKDTP